MSPPRTEISENGVAWLILSRPEKRNALSIEAREAITETLGGWETDDSVRAVAVAGEGEAFCAGFDLEEFGKAELHQRIFDSSAAYHRALWAFPKPTLAAVNGAAFGGGFDLAVLCDLRIASTEARFAHPELRFGAPPLFTPLRWIVGSGWARDLCLGRRELGADHAQRIGLVSEVVAARMLRERANELLERVLEAPQASLEITKAYLVSSEGSDFEASFRREHDEVFARMLGVDAGST